MIELHFMQSGKCNIRMHWNGHTKYTTFLRIKTLLQILYTSNNTTRFQRKVEFNL